MVFYNRLLHCNVIIELKNDEFKHEDLGQLNAYVGYYKKNEMMLGDNPPVGILLCTDKGSQMVEYALSGMDNQLFVSRYMLHLPDKRKLEEFMLKELEEMGRIVNASLDMAESMAKRHIPMTMEDWAKRIDKFINLFESPILQDSGKVSAEYAKEFAESEFEKYRIIQDRLFQSDFDRFEDNSLPSLDME